MIFRVDEDRVVRTRSHARFAADTDRLVEIDYPVGALEHRRCGTRRDARCMRALIAARHLVRAAGLRKHADVYVLDVSSRNGKWNEIFRLAGGRAGMTADAARVVDYLGPLYRGCWLHHQF